MELNSNLKINRTKKAVRLADKHTNGYPSAYLLVKDDNKNTTHLVGRRKAARLLRGYRHARVDSLGKEDTSSAKLVYKHRYSISSQPVKDGTWK